MNDSHGDCQESIFRDLNAISNFDMSDFYNKMTLDMAILQDIAEECLI